MKLYNYWRSSASWRVRVALNLKGVHYEYVPVNIAQGAQREADHHGRNPMDQVPALEVRPGVFLGQSLAILEYLEETHPSPALLPRDHVARATVRELAEMVNSGIQPHQNLTPIGRLDQLADGAGKASAKHFNEVGLAALEARAKHTSGRYLVGDEITFADLCLVPQVYSARRFGVEDLESRFPTLLRVETACNVLDAFKAAHPDRQPDAPR